ncbi:hypothetical protein [Nocardioides rubriscoriae]|uniref:hypothetical protein n=1 Tax=Nocardioides rubriscoriae TaxID=642762 RepID=UPI001B877C5E|nr:hypothetical protein [Nocardioides rubriscoriae]
MTDQTPWDELDDDELMAALAQAVAEAGAVPDRRREAARAAFSWRTVDAELAELLHDSALDAGAAVRSGSAPGVDEPRTLSFGSGALALEVEVDGEVVMGQVVGPTPAPGAATVALQRAEGAEGGEGDEVVVEVDAAGFFRVEGVVSGPVRFVVRADGWALTSPWVVL